MRMYEARQNKEKVSRRIDSAGGISLATLRHHDERGYTALIIQRSSKRPKKKQIRLVGDLHVLRSYMDSSTHSTTSTASRTLTSEVFYGRIKYKVASIFQDRSKGHQLYNGEIIAVKDEKYLAANQKIYDFRCILKGYPDETTYNYVYMEVAGYANSGAPLITHVIRQDNTNEITDFSPSSVPSDLQSDGDEHKDL